MSSRDHDQNRHTNPGQQHQSGQKPQQHGDPSQRGGPARQQHGGNDGGMGKDPKPQNSSKR